MSEEDRNDWSKKNYTAPVGRQLSLPNQSLKMGFRITKIDLPVVTFVGVYRSASQHPLVQMNASAGLHGLNA